MLFMFTERKFAGDHRLFLSLLLLLVVAVFHAPNATASGGQCKWENGAGAPTYPLCKLEDCKGKGGNAQCSAAVGAPEPGPPPTMGPDGWIFDSCPELSSSQHYEK